VSPNQESALPKLAKIIGGMALALFLAAALLIACVIGYFYYQQTIYQHRAELLQTSAGMMAEDGSIFFDQKIKRVFPLGSSANTMAVSLSNLHFKVDEANSRADHKINAFPCLYRWSVWWQVDENGRITSIDGNSSQSCL
jgi:hypothetical protein